MNGGAPLRRIVVIALVGVVASGCVARSAFEDLTARHEEVTRERDDLVSEVQRLEIERDGLEAQYYEAQESFEDERITRSSLASDLAQVQGEAERLDRDLAEERGAHLVAAAALAKRETQIAAMQSTYDELVSDLESEVSSGQIEIERLREGLRLNVAEDVLFASGSAELDSIGSDVLKKVAIQLKELGDFIEVRGHTDDRRIRGALARTYPSNWELAAARAARVVRLFESEGVPGDRLAVVSLGPNDPVAPNDSLDNRALNRRIEIRLEPRERAGGAPES